MKYDYDLVWAAVKKDARAFSFASEKLKTDPVVIEKFNKNFKPQEEILRPINYQDISYVRKPRQIKLANQVNFREADSESFDHP